MRMLRPAVGSAVLALLLSVPTAHADDLAEVRAMTARGDLAPALRRVEAAVAAKPGDAALRFQQGVILMDLGRDAAALEVFTRLSEEFPELPDPLNNMALLHSRAGEHELARQALQAALRNDPRHRLARANLGRVHLALAAQAWERLSADGPLEQTLQRQLQAVRGLLAEGVRGNRTPP